MAVPAQHKRETAPGLAGQWRHGGVIRFCVSASRRLNPFLGPYPQAYKASQLPSLRRAPGRLDHRPVHIVEVRGGVGFVSVCWVGAGIRQAQAGSGGDGASQPAGQCCCVAPARPKPGLSRQPASQPGPGPAASQPGRAAATSHQARPSQAQERNEKWPSHRAT